MYISVAFLSSSRWISIAEGVNHLILLDACHCVYCIVLDCPSNDARYMASLNRDISRKSRFYGNCVD